MHYFTKLLLTLNQRVWGSSPQGITIEINKCESTFFVSYVPKSLYLSCFLKLYIIINKRNSVK